MAGNLFQNNLPVLVAAINYPNNYVQVEQIRCISKHWNPKWKKLRREKVIKIKLPSFDDKDDDPTNMNKEEVRSRMKEHGFLPQKPWQERPAFISSTPGIFESYVAPEGDGKYSAVTKEVHPLCFYIVICARHKIYNVLLVLKYNKEWVFFNNLFCKI